MFCRIAVFTPSKSGLAHFPQTIVTFHCPRITTVPGPVYKSTDRVLGAGSGITIIRMDRCLCLSFPFCLLIGKPPQTPTIRSVPARVQPERDTPLPRKPPLEGEPEP